jgi:dihydroorotase-like cyclic amidohydrolase
MSDKLLQQYLVKISQWLSTRPAEILNLSSRKGSISAGKDADFVIWDPFRTEVVSSSCINHPETTPFIGEELCGVIHRTYLRGELVYSSDSSQAVGCYLTPK